MSDWNPELYNRFRRYRAEPFEAILSKLAVAADDHVIDLGCGSGENTVELARRADRGFAVGIDSSPAMIDRAQKLRETLDQDLRARLKFELDDVRNLNAENEYSIVFSNAVLQWVAGHRGIFTACLRALKPGGHMVVQMPANEDEAAQATMVVMANEDPWRAMIGGLETPSRTVASPDEYSVMLGEIGFTDVECYYHTFHHPMSSPAEVVEWSRATALRPFLEGLPADKRDAFTVQLTSRLADAYGTNGSLTFNFRRLFIWARRPAN